MIELTRSARFGQKPDGGVLIREQVRVDDLDRHRPTQDRLLRLINTAHSSHTDELQDVIAGRERRPDELVAIAPRNRTDREPAGGTVLAVGSARIPAMRAGGFSRAECQRCVRGTHRWRNRAEFPRLRGREQFTNPESGSFDAANHRTPVVVLGLL